MLEIIQNGSQREAARVLVVLAGHNAQPAPTELVHLHRSGDGSQPIDLEAVRESNHRKIERPGKFSTERIDVTLTRSS